MLYWNTVSAGGLRPIASVTLPQNQGVIPTIKVGRLRFVPVAQADLALGISQTATAPTAQVPWLRVAK
jgi:hypothetical protein